MENQITVFLQANSTILLVAGVVFTILASLAFLMSKNTSRKLNNSAIKMDAETRALGEKVARSSKAMAVNGYILGAVCIVSSLAIKFIHTMNKITIIAFVMVAFATGLAIGVKMPYNTNYKVGEVVQYQGHKATITAASPVARYEISMGQSEPRVVLEVDGRQLAKNN